MKKILLLLTILSLFAAAICAYDAAEPQPLRRRADQSFLGHE